MSFDQPLRAFLVLQRFSSHTKKEKRETRTDQGCLTTSKKSVWDVQRGLKGSAIGSKL